MQSDSLRCGWSQWPQSCAVDDGQGPGRGLAESHRVIPKTRSQAPKLIIRQML